MHTHTWAHKHTHTHTHIHKSVNFQTYVLITFIQKKYYNRNNTKLLIHALFFLHSNIENAFPTRLPIYAQVVNMLNYWETEFNICGFPCFNQSGHISKRTVFTRCCGILPNMSDGVWMNFHMTNKNAFYSVGYVFLMIKSPCQKMVNLFYFWNELQLENESVPHFFHGVETQCHHAFVFPQMLLSFALDVNHPHHVLLLCVCTVKIRSRGEYHGCWNLTSVSFQF